MKNKKSKIIVPALGLILLSTAASISGSVAWFTASRTATVDTGTFAIVKTDGTLGSSLTDGVGTDTSTGTVNPITGATLANASYNPSTKQLYTNKGDQGASGFRELGGNTSHSTAEADNAHAWKVSTNAKVYYAFSWKVTLTYTWSADDTPLNVYFDYNASSVANRAMQEGQTSTANKTETGFRVALLGPTHNVVWGKLQGAANLKGVYGTGANNAAVYGQTNLTNSNFGYFASDFYGLGNVDAATSSANRIAVGDYSKATDGDANSTQTSRPDYLGTITRANAQQNSTSIDVWCVAWFEGTDPNVMDNNELDQLTATIGFYATTAGN